MMRFLAPLLLAAAGVLEFDQWAATFAEVVTAIELAPEGGSAFRQKSRFARFVNVPELLRIFHTFADVKLAEDLNLEVPLVARRDDGKREARIVATEPDPVLENYVADLGERADLIRQKKPREFGTGEIDEFGVEFGVEIKKLDNMLWVSTDGRKAALDLREVGLRQTSPGKIANAAKVIAEVWRNNPGKLQLVFCDLSTPKHGWNAYDELRNLLIAEGMDPAGIRFAHSAKNDRAKGQLFRACRSGHVQVLMGSTERMGVGTNVQDHVIALHHLDAPWRPADLAQRDGRAFRQGNLNPEVMLFRHVTLRSFDAYMWQTLERKARFIAQFMRGRLDVREINDVGDVALSYEEVKAITTGNPLLLEAAEAAAERTRLERAERAHGRNQKRLEWGIQGHRQDIGVLEERILQLDGALRRREDVTGEKFMMTVDGLPYEKRSDAGAQLVAFLEAECQSVIQDMAAQARRKMSRERVPAGWLGGFQVLAFIEGYDRVHAGAYLWLDGVPESDFFVAGVAGLDEVDPAGLVRRLENRLGRLEGLIGAAQERITGHESEIVHAEAGLGATFPHGAELEAARIRCEEIKTEMARLAQQTEKDLQTRDAAQRAADLTAERLARQATPAAG
jgi:hypothetical protein